MPSVPSKTDPVSKAGISTNSDGQRHIASSVRSDGTVRKEIKIRPGYRPPEDVEVYKNRTAEGFRNRGKGPVPGAEAVDPDEKNSASASKNAKRRDARKKAAADVTSSTTSQQQNEGETNGKGPQASPPEDAKPVDPEAEKEKEAKKLAKKLRQARELKEKKDQGTALLPEQFDKVIKINELIRQLEVLGFDAEGKRKEAAG